MTTTATADLPAEAEPRRGVHRVADLVVAHPLLTVFLVAFAARAIASAIIYARTGGSLFADDATYSDMATAVVRGQTGSWDDFTRHLYDSAATFTLPLTLLYDIVGPVHLAGQLLAGLAGSLAAVAATKLASYVVAVPRALVAGGLVALLPSQILFSSLTLKDPFVWATVAAVALTAAAANRRSGRRLVPFGLLLLVLLLAVAHLRPHTLIVVCWSLAIAVWFGPKSGRLTRGSFAVAVAVLLPFALGAGVAGSDLVRYAGRLERLRLGNAIDAATAFVKPPPRAPAYVEVKAAQDDVLKAQAEADELAARAVQHPDAEAQRLAAEAAARLAEAQRRAADLARRFSTPLYPDEESFGANVAHLPKGISVMLVEPYPWAINANSRVRLAGAELVFWYPLLVLAAIGMWTGRRRLDVLLLPFLVGGGALLMYALTEGNFGTAYRHRGEMVWALAVFAAVGADVVWVRWQARRSR